MFYFISKIGWLLVQPLGLLSLALAALVIVSIGHRARVSAWIAALSLLGVLAGSQTNLGRLMLQPLESRNARPAAQPNRDDVAGVIVLGGGFDGYVTRSRGGFELGESGDRFVEALRLARLYPDVRVIVSGGEASLIGETEGDAAIARRFFDAFGLDSERLIFEDRSLNTYENAVLTKTVLPAEIGGDWLLVTSAFHMPRSMAAFRRQDVPVIAWPVDYRTTGKERFSIGRDDPAEALKEVTLALREWLGILVYRATGRIDAV